jgi:hypothetical protein
MTAKGKHALPHSISIMLVSWSRRLRLAHTVYRACCFSCLDMADDV